MSRERRDHTLQPTALANETYLRLLDRREPNWENRTHNVGASPLARRSPRSPAFGLEWAPRDPPSQVLSRATVHALRVSFPAPRPLPDPRFCLDHLGSGRPRDDPGGDRRGGERRRDRRPPGHVRRVHRLLGEDDHRAEPRRPAGDHHRREWARERGYLRERRRIRRRAGRIHPHQRHGDHVGIQSPGRGGLLRVRLPDHPPERDHRQHRPEGRRRLLRLLHEPHDSRQHHHRQHHGRRLLRLVHLGDHRRQRDQRQSAAEQRLVCNFV